MAIPNNRVNRFIEDQDARVSVGIKLPFGRQPGSSKGYFATTDTTLDAVKQDVRLLLMTQRGERLFQPLLGMNIRRFLFEQVTENTVVEIENDIVDTFERWLPFVNLSEINIDLESKNQIRINVQFNIENAPTELESVGVVLE
jgi:phage baseplate assembly protein W